MSEEEIIPEGIKEELSKKYLELRPKYEKLVEEVIFTLNEIIENSDVKKHSIVSRGTKIKEFESFYNKVVEKKYFKDSFKKVNDIAGVRVILLYRNDLEKIEELIKRNFELVEMDNSRTRTETPFGYQSDHYIVQIIKSNKGLRYDDIKNINCEIQVRTILMDAWASVSHHLDYKKEIDLPKELKTDFNALSGLFYIADTHFELFKNGVEETREKLEESVKEGTLDLKSEINLDSLTAYLQYKFPERDIKRSDINFYGWSKIIGELGDYDIRTIEKLDNMINKTTSVLKEFELKQSGYNEWRKMWAPDGLIRNILNLTIDEYYHTQKIDLEKVSTSKKMKEWLQLRVAIFEEFRNKVKKPK